MKIKKAVQKQIEELNGIIHRENLYSADGRRMINAHADEAGRVVLEDLYTGQDVPYVENGFRNGYGSTVAL